MIWALIGLGAFALFGCWRIMANDDTPKQEPCEQRRGARIGDGNYKCPPYVPKKGTTQAAKNKKLRKKRFKNSYPLDCWRRKNKRKRGRS
jgi:hypothetical protein